MWQSPGSPDAMMQLTCTQVAATSSVIGILPACATCTIQLAIPTACSSVRSLII